MGILSQDLDKTVRHYIRGVVYMTSQCVMLTWITGEQLDRQVSLNKMEGLFFFGNSFTIS